MKRPPRMLFALFAACVLMWPAAAIAADCSAGKKKFDQICLGCHDAASRAGKSAADILNALGNQAAMQGLYPNFVNATDVDNIAAYLFFYPAACPASPPQAGATAIAFEYYHQAFDHYFVTAIGDEITKLDNGTFVGWARTGRSFKVYPNAAAGLSAVCRFFSTAFAPKSSHFYTPHAPECATVKESPDWQFEGEVFFMPMPASDGTCPANTDPVYRLYNNGQGGAPNHRYTTDLTERSVMLGLGWIPEGSGTGVIMCAPQ